jgi:hypothetical protein
MSHLSAHSKFTKYANVSHYKSIYSSYARLYKTVFPDGLQAYRTPSATPVPSRKSSMASLHSSTLDIEKKAPPPSSFFGRWTGSSTLLVPKSPSVHQNGVVTEGPIDELIVAGTGFGVSPSRHVFQLFCSLTCLFFRLWIVQFGILTFTRTSTVRFRVLRWSPLPPLITDHLSRSVVGFLGFTHDRNLALQALAVSAAKKDVHSVFAGFVFSFVIYEVFSAKFAS